MSARLGFPNLAGPALDAAAPLPVGSQIEAHSVLQVLSEGPNGFVYLTRDATHGATRVLKEFMPRSRLLRLSDGSVRPCDVSDSIATSVARIAFMNEANTLAAFQHPALVRVLGVIPAHRTLYRVMPLVDGVSLEQHCRARADVPSVAWLHGLVEGLLQALEVLHERRLGHGSVRAAQVMVREGGQPLLLGFASVARELDAVSPTPWQSPGAAQLMRHAPPVPADDLPALAQTVYFAATGLEAPTLQQRSEGAALDVRQALLALPDGPGDSQQRRRGLLLGLEAAFSPSANARPQSVAEFRRLLSGDVPARGRRLEPTPRWVGELPERDETEVDLLISQPAPLADDLPPTLRPVVAAATVASAIPPATPPVVARVAPVAPVPPSVAASFVAVHEAFVASPQPVASEPAVQPAEPIEAQPGWPPADKPVPEAAWPFEPEVASRTTEAVPAPEAVPVAVPPSAAEPLAENARAAAADAAPPATIERELAGASRSRVERDFAATEFLVRSVDVIETPISFAGADPDTEPFVANLRPHPAPRTRSPSAAMAALMVLMLMGAGIVAWWQFEGGQAAVPAATATSPPPLARAPAETPRAATPAPEATTAAPAVVAAPEAPLAIAEQTPARPDATTPGAAPTPTLAQAPTPAPVAVFPPAADAVTATAPPIEPTVAQTSEPPPQPPSQARNAAPPPNARRAPSQRATAAMAARAGKPAASRSGTATARTAARADSARVVRAHSPLAACGNRTQFSLVYCMQQQCALPAYRAHPQCADLRNGG